MRAQARLSHDYTRVKNTEALYYLGYLYQMTGRTVEAEEALWAATWTPDFKHPAIYQLAVAAVRAKDYPKALELIALCGGTRSAGIEREGLHLASVG